MKRILFTGLLLVTGFTVNAQSTKSLPSKKTVTKVVPVKKEVIRNVPVLPVIKKVSIKDVRSIMDTTSGPLIVNFWATWCGPCIREIPYFDSLIAVKGKPVKLLLVSLDFPEAYPKQISSFVSKQGYKGEVVYLNEKDADYFCPVVNKKWTGAIPVSVFINNDKKSQEFFGFQLTRERFALELDKLLE
jgi:thiol-disulfide isomerase/thioredoxin